MTITCPSCGHKFPAPLRSTGKHSQNHALWGFASQISRYMDDGTTNREVLEEAMRRAGIESKVNNFGVSVYRESNLSKAEASLVIDALREIAQFLEMRLVELNE